MKKGLVNHRSMLSGILLGVSAALLTFVLAGAMVFTSGDFWLKQEEKHKHTQKLMLYSSDDYSTLYHSYFKLFNGGLAPDKPITVTYHNDPEKHTATYIDAEPLECADIGLYQYSDTVELDEKYMASLKEYCDAVKKPFTYENGFRIDLNIVPETKNAEKKSNSIIDFKNIFISDENGKRLDWQLVYSYYDEKGKTQSESFDNACDIQLETNLDVKLVLVGNTEFSKVNVSFAFQNLVEGCTVNPRLTYREEITNIDVAKKIGYEAEITTYDERVQIKNVGDLKDYATLFAVVLLIAAIVFAIRTVIKENRISLFGIGLYTILSAIFTGVIICVLLNTTVMNVFNFNQDTVSYLLISRAFMKDLSVGISRFYAFLMVIPVVVGYSIMKSAIRKKDDPNEDYMYQ